MPPSPSDESVAIAHLYGKLLEVSTSITWIAAVGGVAILAGGYAAWDMVSKLSDLKQTIGQIQGTIGPKPDDPNQTILNKLNELINSMPKAQQAPVPDKTGKDLKQP